MVKNTGVGSGNVIGYDRIQKRLPNGFSVSPDENVHNCQHLIDANVKRLSSGEGMVYIFRDVENKKLNVKIGLEFVEMNFCPFCGKKL